MGNLGRTLCTELARQGVSLVLCDIEANGLVGFAAEMKNFGASAAHPLQMDVRSEISVKAAFKDLEHNGITLDAVVNSSYPRNQNYGRRLEEVTLKDFSENTCWHLGGYFIIAQYACKHFDVHNHGSLINVSSIYGSMPPRFEIYAGTPMTMPVEYAAIKSGVLHITRYFAQYYKKNGIRVNSVSPGGILASQPESFLAKYNNYCGVKGMLDTDDILGAILFLISDASKYMTGQNLIVDDGFSL